MAAVSAQTRQTLTAISGLIQLNLVNQASVDLTKLIRDLGPHELVLASHDIRSQIERLQNQRRRGLLEELGRRLGNVSSAPQVSSGPSARSAVSPAATERMLSERAKAMLLDLASNYIFKWSPNYRDALSFIVDSALKEFPTRATSTCSCPQSRSSSRPIPRRFSAAAMHFRSSAG